MIMAEASKKKESQSTKNSHHEVSVKEMWISEMRRLAVIGKKHTKPSKGRNRNISLTKATVVGHSTLLRAGEM